MMLEFKDITVNFGSVQAVRGLSLAVREKELLTLLGPSGCGKSTLIKVAAGFLRPSAGKVCMAGHDVTGIPPEERPTATVFQSHALFPHLSVADNVAYGLKARRVPVDQRRRMAGEMLERVGLDGFGTRPVQALSGGQQQRVALARALVLNPSILLLDEPLASLDASLRVQMRQEIRRLQQAFGIAALYVTHDQEEALSISDRVAVLRQGQLVGLDTPEKLYAAPKDPFVAVFVSGANVLLAPDTSPDAPSFLFLQPGSLRLIRSERGSGRVLERQYKGAVTTYLVALGQLHGRAVQGGVLRVDVRMDVCTETREGPNLLPQHFEPGDQVEIEI